jgi:NTE family protein
MKALVLSGGGAKGAFQVGVLKTLLKEEHNKYDILCGVSVGALNSSFLSMYKKGEEEAAWLNLRALWDTIRTKKIYKHWLPFSYLQAPFEPSVYNSAPLQKLVRSRLDPVKIKTSGRKLRVGAVNIDTGEYKLFKESDPNIVDGVLASSSFPVMLTPIYTEGSWWTDGGVRNVTPLNAAIDLGATEIDVVLTMPKKEEIVPKKKYTSIQIALRSLEYMMDEIVRTDFDKVQLINEILANLPSDKLKINSKYKPIKLRLFQPDVSLTHNSLDFSQKNIRAMYKVGLEIGARDA